MNSMTTHQLLQWLHNRSLAIIIYCLHKCTSYYIFWMFTFLNITTTHSTRTACLGSYSYKNFNQNYCGIEAFWHSKRFRAIFSAKDDSFICSDWLNLENEAISKFAFPSQLCVLMILNSSLIQHMVSASLAGHICDNLQKHVLRTPAIHTDFEGFAVAIRQFIFSNQHMLIILL
jgi:hypothetical protein